MNTKDTDCNKEGGQNDKEDKLINQRLTWLFQSQALLIAGYGLVITSESLLHIPAITLSKPFVFLGIATSSVIFVGILAAAIAIHFIWYDLNTRTGRRLRPADPGYTPLGVRALTTWMGLATALAMPLIFIYSWIYVASSAPEFRSAIENKRESTSVERDSESTREPVKSQVDSPDQT